MIRTVVHFTDTAGFGGAEKMLLATLAGLDRTRWRPVLMHYPNAAAAELAAAARDLGVDTRDVPGATGVRGIPELRRFAAALRDEEASILHAHLVGPLRCTKSFIAARMAGVVPVATQHLYGDLPRPIDRLRQRFAAALVERYIAVSEGIARELREQVARAEKVVVIRNAIDPTRFLAADGEAVRRELVGETGRALVLVLARLHERKGITYLISAVESLPDVVLAIAGEGPEMSRLTRQAADAGIADRVRFLGTRNDVPELLAACDLFVLPSFTEGLPVSVIEAMTAGKAVVATAIPGTDEVVADGQTGVLVPAGDRASLRTWIRWLIDDPDARARMGEAGRRRAEELFWIDGMIRRIESLYESLLAGAGARRSGADSDEEGSGVEGSTAEGSGRGPSGRAGTAIDRSGAIVPPAEGEAGTQGGNFALPEAGMAAPGASSAFVAPEASGASGVSGASGAGSDRPNGEPGSSEGSAPGMLGSEPGVASGAGLRAK